MVLPALLVPAKPLVAIQGRFKISQLASSGTRAQRAILGEGGGRFCSDTLEIPENNKNAAQCVPSFTDPRRRFGAVHDGAPLGRTPDTSFFFNFALSSVLGRT